MRHIMLNKFYDFVVCVKIERIKKMRKKSNNNKNLVYLKFQLFWL